MFEAKGDGANSKPVKMASLWKTHTRLLRSNLKKHLFQFLACQRKAWVRDAGDRCTEKREKIGKVMQCPPLLKRHGGSRLKLPTQETHWVILEGHTNERQMFLERERS